MISLETAQAIGNDFTDEVLASVKEAYATAGTDPAAKIAAETAERAAKIAATLTVKGQIGMLTPAESADLAAAFAVLKRDKSLALVIGAEKGKAFAEDFTASVARYASIFARAFITGMGVPLPRI